MLDTDSFDPKESKLIKIQNYIQLVSFKAYSSLPLD
jgi:hypothetical protein